MSQTKEQVEQEFAQWKQANPDYLTNENKGAVLASYNNRLASFVGNVYNSI